MFIEKSLRESEYIRLSYFTEGTCPIQPCIFSSVWWLTERICLNAHGVKFSWYLGAHKKANPISTNIQAYKAK